MGLSGDKGGGREGPLPSGSDVKSLVVICTRLFDHPPTSSQPRTSPTPFSRFIKMANAAEEKKAVVKVKFVKAERSGLRVGLARGKKVVLTTASKPSPARRRGALAPRVRVVREIIRDVCGLAPYEKRILDVIKVSSMAWLAVRERTGWWEGEGRGMRVPKGP